MSIPLALKESHRQSVMNVSGRNLLTPLALIFGARYTCKPSRLPSDTVASWRPSLPSRMRPLNLEFCLPLGHTAPIAEGAPGVKVGCRPFNAFSAPFAQMICAAAAPNVVFSGLILYSAIEGAKSLIPFSCTCGLFIARKTLWRRLRCSPPIQEIAFSGAESLGLFRHATVGRVKRLFASRAIARLGAFHIAIIPIEEKHCETAAMRLSQEVLDLAR
jgi:hypothetical protein